MKKIKKVILFTHDKYQKNKDTTLDLLHFTGDEDSIKNNRLLRVENDRIHFLFEEITLKELKWQ